MRVLGRFIVAIFLAGLGVAVGSVLLFHQVDHLLGSGVAGTEGDPLSLQPLAVRSVVYARDGSVLATFHAEEDRVPVSLDKVPAPTVRAVLDAEDDRFYEHGPIDLRALTRALVVNIEAGGVHEGGSTITQQLVKLSLLNSHQKADRKLKEAALAIRLESTMSKRQILERYMNEVYFGNGAYGLQAAGETYFHTDVDKLTLGQSILLSSMIRDPVGSDPWAHPVAARTRRDLVIDRMRDLGHISGQDAERFKGEALPAPPPEPPARGSDYFTEHVKQQLLGDPRLGTTPQERYASVFKGGLSIHTTLDPVGQQKAEEAVARILPNSGGQFNAALVSVDPASGAVRALVGGPGFGQSKFNLAADGTGRQPGSAFKPFTLMAAVESGFAPEDTILGSSPCPIPNPGGAPAVWTPDNVEGEAPGVLTLTDATAHSVNCAFARLVKMVGPEHVVDAAKRMGISAPLEPNLSITLGTEEVTPLQMASAYGTLAADGVHHAPVFIDKVEDLHGKVVFTADTRADQVVSPQNARTVTKMLTSVVQRGTGRAAAVPGWTVAGKTGTTDNNTNAWFVGYTPTLVTAVWMGSPSANVPMRRVGGITVFGGTYPARIWQAYMAAALAGTPPVPFPQPAPMYGSGFHSLQGERAPNSAAAAAAETPFAPVPVPPDEPVIVAEIPQLPDVRSRIPEIVIPDIPNIPDITVPPRPHRPPKKPKP